MVNSKFLNLRNFEGLKRSYWYARQFVQLPAERNSEILYRIRRQMSAPPTERQLFQFPWGNFEYVNLGQLASQFEEIYIGRQYAFKPEFDDPVIIDCGGNIGMSAVWFKLNYPTCRLTVYEPDPTLAGILHSNLDRVGFSDVEVRRKAVWINNDPVKFHNTGDDSGRIAAEGGVEFPAEDLAQIIPERVDLLKLDIEGAEYSVIEKLRRTGAIDRIRRLVCEFHVRRDQTDELLSTLASLRESGMEFAVSGGMVPWLGMADEESPFEVVNRKQILLEVFAWRPGQASNS